jgi:hypothetical protein
MVEVARMIAEEAGKRYPAYNWLVDGLGVHGNIKALEALAELIPYLGQPMGLRKMINLLGLFRPVRGRKKIYSGHLRRALQRLTASENNTTSFRLTAKKEKQMLSKIWRIYRQEALEAGHADAGIKPRGRHDGLYDVHPDVGCYDDTYDGRPPIGFPK